jgi:hypothetical protein
VTSVRKKLNLLGKSCFIFSMTSVRFIHLCQKGKLGEAKKLWRQKMLDRYGEPIDLHAEGDKAFRYACQRGNLETMEWLYGLSQQPNQTTIDLDPLIDDLFESCCRNGHLHVAEWLWGFVQQLKLKIDPQLSFRQSCVNGHLRVAKWIFEKLDQTGEIDLHLDDDHAFRWSCAKGHLSVAQWLWSLGQRPGETPVDLNADHDMAFRFSCMNGHLEVAQWVWKLGLEPGQTPVNIHALDNFAWRTSCGGDHVEVALWLKSLAPRVFFLRVMGRYKKIIDFRVVEWYHSEELTLESVVKHLQIKSGNAKGETCQICMDLPEEIFFDCRHGCCHQCFAAMYFQREKKICPYCRQEVDLARLTVCET